MKRSIGLWQLMGFAVTSVLGTALHFLYELTGGSMLASFFSSINESTWEHMKLFFWPAFAFAIIESFFFKDRHDFFCIKLRGILLGLALIPILFYTYTGVIGRSYDWINISIFFISAAAAFLYETRKFKRASLGCKDQRPSIAALCLIALLFVVFTVSVPDLSLFADPLAQ